MIHNNAESLCLEDSNGDAGVQLKRCSVDSELQQWVWLEQMFLMNIHTQRCLSADLSDPIKTLDCDGLDDLHWQCMNHRLISQSHSLKLGVHKGKLVLTNTEKSTTWKSLDQGNICQERLSECENESVTYWLSNVTIWFNTLFHINTNCYLKTSFCLCKFAGHMYG